MAVIAIHPGEQLAEELKELGMSAAELARRLNVPTNRITAILNGQRSITGDTASEDYRLTSGIAARGSLAALIAGIARLQRYPQIRLATQGRR